MTAPDIQHVCDAYLEGLGEILGDALHGVYTYGAAMFEDGGTVQDLDCHVILDAAPSDEQRSRLIDLHRDLEIRFPPLGVEVDAYCILADGARKRVPPPNQLIEIRDESWALHSAPVRGGRYRTLLGSEPADIFPIPSWSALTEALDHELAFISDNLRYPDYCTLNLCRIIRSFEEKNVVRSKHGSGRWASERYAQWKGLIQAAIRSYANTATDADNALLRDQVVPFHQFALDEIRRIRDVDSAFDFLDPGELVDGDLELILTHQALGDPSRGHLPFYRFTMCVNGTIDAGILVRRSDTRSSSRIVDIATRPGAAP